jgi:hypothetical protein
VKDFKIPSVTDKYAFLYIDDDRQTIEYLTSLEDCHFTHCTDQSIKNHLWVEVAGVIHPVTENDFVRISVNTKKNTISFWIDVLAGFYSVTYDRANLTKKEESQNEYKISHRRA